MKSGATSLVIVFPAIIAVTRGCDSHSTNSGAKDADNDKRSFGLPVIQKISLDEIKPAILTSLSKRDWIVTDQFDGTISAELLHRRMRGKLSISYDSESISIENLSTDNAGRPHTPDRAIKALMNEIQKNLLAGISVCPSPERGGMR